MNHRGNEVLRSSYFVIYLYNINSPTLKGEVSFSHTTFSRRKNSVFSNTVYHRNVPMLPSQKLNDSVTLSPASITGDNSLMRVA